MADDWLQGAIEAVSRRIRDELAVQLAQLSSRHAQALEAALRTAEAEAERRWSAKFDELRGEWAGRLESEVAAVRAEADRRLVAESTRVRVEAEQIAAETAARARRELEQAVNEERHRAAAQLIIERQQLSTDYDQIQRELHDANRQLAELLEELETLKASRAQEELARQTERRAREDADARQSEQHAADLEARVAERQAQLATVERLLGAMRSLDAARSLSEILAALVAAAAREAPRVALFVRMGGELKCWKLEGFEIAPGSVRVESTGDELLAWVLRSGEPVATGAGGPAPPAFARLPPTRAAIAVPLLVGNQPAGVLYADDGAEAEGEAPSAWPEAIQILCRHGSACLSHVTASRAREGLRPSQPAATVAPAHGQQPPGVAEDAARRSGHVMLSEITRSIST